MGSYVLPFWEKKNAIQELIKDYSSKSDVFAKLEAFKELHVAIMSLDEGVYRFCGLFSEGIVDFGKGLSMILLHSFIHKQGDVERRRIIGALKEYLLTGKQHQDYPFFTIVSAELLLARLYHVCLHTLEENNIVPECRGLSTQDFQSYGRNLIDIWDNPSEDEFRLQKNKVLWASLWASKHLRKNKIRGVYEVRNESDILDVIG